MDLGGTFLVLQTVPSTGPPVLVFAVTSLRLLCAWNVHVPLANFVLVSTQNPEVSIFLSLLLLLLQHPHSQPPSSFSEELGQLPIKATMV